MIAVIGKTSNVRCGKHALTRLLRTTGSQWPNSGFLLSTVFCLLTSPVLAQVTRLPPTDLTTQPPTAQMISYPGNVSQVLSGPGELGRPPSFDSASGTFVPAEAACMGVVELPLPPEHRSGFFQKILFDYTYLPRLDAQGMGINDVEGKIVFAVPFPTVEWPLLIVPGYGVHFFDGPENVEMPARLHDAYLAFRWLPKFSDQLSADVTVAPGVFSDFEQSSDDAFRITGYAVAIYAWTPAVKLVAGVGYFDRLTVDWLPVGGIIWTPTERVNFGLLFPRPKLAIQFSGFGADGRLVQNWAFLAAEFGGSAWAFRRSDGTDDVVDFRDYRLTAGVERKIRGGLETRFELGYVFGREIQYKSHAPSFEPSDTLMVRAALAY